MRGSMQIAHSRTKRAFSRNRENGGSAWESNRGAEFPPHRLAHSCDSRVPPAVEASRLAPGILSGVLFSAVLIGLVAGCVWGVLRFPGVD